MTTIKQRLIGLHHHSLDAVGDFPAGDPGDLLYFDADGVLQVLAPGTDGQILALDSGFPVWTDAAAGSSHALLSLTHTDTTPAAPTRGDLITAQGGTPKWTALSIGASGDYFGSDGTDPGWKSPGALTKTDDTNVTLALGGTPTTALLHAVSLTLGWTGLLSLARGGTHADLSATGGAGAYLKQSSVGADVTVGTIPASDIASGAALTKTNDTNVTLTLGGTPSAALLAAASLTLGWTGLLGLARGGTHADLSATGGTGQYLKQSSTGADVTVGTIPASDIASGAALTKTNDTNVTLTLGGSPASALLAAASLTLGWTGLLGLARGGTHADLSATGGTGQVLKQATTGADVTVGTLAASEIASGAALTKTDDTNVTLSLGGSAASALLAATSLTLGWTGSLAIGRGGTGQTTKAAAFDALSPMSASGDIIYGGTSGTGTRLAKGSDGQVLTLASGVPSWAPGGSVSGANPTASVGLSAVNGSATTYLRSDGAPALDVTIAPVWTGLHSWHFDALAATQDDAKGIRLYNATVAVNGTRVQISPAIRFSGGGWHTTGSGANALDMRMYLKPTTAAATAFSSFVFEFQTDGGGYTERMRFESVGNIVVTNNLTVSGGITTAGVTSSGTISATGYQVSGAATSGHVLRGNGTSFVDAALTAADISGVDVQAWDAPSALTAPSFATVPRMLCMATLTLLTGRLVLNAIWLPAGFTVHTLSFIAASTMAGQTHQIAGLFDSSFAQLATSADGTNGTWTSGTVKTFTMGTPYPVVTSGLYYVGLFYVGTAGFTLFGPAAANTGVLGVTNQLAGTGNTGLTTALPNPATFGSTQAPYYAVAN